MMIVINISMIILLSPKLQNDVPYAEKLLDYFIKTFEILYGREHNSHNIHGSSLHFHKKIPF